MKFLLLPLFCAMAVLSSCTNEIDDLSSKNDVATIVKSRSVSEELDVETAQKRFAKILSKAVYDNMPLRQFLKDEAIKQFDNDYDVFYPLVKGMKVMAEKTFYDILLDYSSEEELNSIENAVPLLNIYVPDLSLFDNITAYNWDVNDEEIPVAVSNTNGGTILFCQGDSIDSLAGDEVPDFHLLLVKQNERVRPVENFSRSINDNQVMPGYEFVNEVFNGSKRPEIQTLALDAPTLEDDYVNSLDPKIIEAWNTMKSNPAYQRDYIYYGMTPQKTEGKLNGTIDEYLYRFQISPTAYYSISDDRDKTSSKSDPYIKEGEKKESKKEELPKDIIITALWAEGNYEFEFRIYTGTKKDDNVGSQVLVFNIAPKDLWEINITTKRRHHTAFRHTKYTYTISPENLGRKWYYPRNFSYYPKINKWDISQQSMEKTIFVVERDQSKTIDKTIEVKKKYATNFKSNIEGSIKPDESMVGDIKLGLGFDTSASTETTTMVKTTIQEKDDDLGTLELDFYSSIIVEKIAGKGYRLKNISNGTVTLTILPMSETYARSVY